MRRAVLQFLICGCALAWAATASAQTPAAAPKSKGIWEPVNYGEDLPLFDAFFVTPETGYVGGAGGTILKTTDAGASWTPLLGGDPQSQEGAIKQLWFVTPTLGWAAQDTSSQTNLFRTTDGESWARIGVMNPNYEDLAFTSESDGIYVDNMQIFRTHDGGKSWKPVFDCVAKAEIDGLMRQVQCDLQKISFASPSVVYALARTTGGVTAAVVVKSGDGGSTWSVLSTIPDENANEGGLFFLDEKTGYLTTHYAKSAYRTVDGGLTWTGMPATTISRNLVFADPGVGWSMHFNRLSYTTDGGKRWFSRELAFPAMPNAFSLPRRDRAYAVGDHGMIYRYSVVPESAPVAARVLVSPAMPGLDNAVLAQLQQLESRLEKIGDGSGAAVGQELQQLQSTVEAVASGVPAMGSRYRSLNLVMHGLKVSGDLTVQAGALKEAFTTLRQSTDPDSAATALQSLQGQLDAMKTSAETFKSLRAPGS